MFRPRRHDDRRVDDAAGLAVGESEVRGAARAETRVRTGITSVVPWLVVSEVVGILNAETSMWETVSTNDLLSMVPSHFSHEIR